LQGYFPGTEQANPPVEKTRAEAVGDSEGIGSE
jgi:hypothetical protein